MIQNDRKEIQTDDKLLTTVMAIFNISIFVAIGIVIWSVYLVLENSAAIGALLSGSFLP